MNLSPALRSHLSLEIAQHQLYGGIAGVGIIMPISLRVRILKCVGKPSGVIGTRIPLYFSHTFITKGGNQNTPTHPNFQYVSLYLTPLTPHPPKR